MLNLFGEKPCEPICCRIASESLHFGESEKKLKIRMGKIEPITRQPKIYGATRVSLSNPLPSSQE